MNGLWTAILMMTLPLAVKSSQCGRDSAVVISSTVCDGQPNRCTYNLSTDHYNLTTGQLNDTSYWTRNENHYNPNGSLNETVTLRGSETGWQNYESSAYRYNAAGQQTDCHERSWNGTSWDTVRWTYTSYDPQGLINSLHLNKHDC